MLRVPTRVVHAETDHWFERPAILWSRTENNLSAYWKSSSLAHFTSKLKWQDDDDNDDRVFLSYNNVFYLALHIADRIVLTLLDELCGKSCCLGGRETGGGDDDDDDDDDTMLLQVTVAVAIPEGPFQSLAIAAVHAANIPYRRKVSLVLVPIEPTEGVERVEKIVQDAKPLVLLVAADCDQTRLQAIVDKTKTSSGSVAGEATCVTIRSIKMLRPCTSRVVDLREWVSEVASSPKDRQDREKDLLCKRLCHLLVQNEDATLLDLFAACWEIIASRDTPVGPPGNSSRAAAYYNENRISHLVYTSGTTGTPKGCLSSLHSLQKYIASKNTLHQITNTSTVLLASALSFDPCLSDVLATLSARATLAIVSRDELRQSLFSVLHSFSITHCLCTPTLWMGTMGVTAREEEEELPCLQVVALGGEPIPEAIVKAWARRRKANHEATSTTSSGGLRRLCATYGVTEACVYQTLGEIFSDQQQQVGKGQDVGFAFPGLDVRICLESEQTKLVDAATNDGAVLHQTTGEIVLCGGQLDEFSGYLSGQVLAGAQENNKFPFDGTRYCYRTGDRGFIDPVTKRLVVLGRIQGARGMIKIHGVRVELGEIEAAITSEEVGNEGNASVVVDCFVVASGEENSSTAKDLIAYVVLSSSFLDETSISTAGIPVSGLLCTPPLLTLLRERCRLRARVIPSAFIIIPRVPLSPTGKRYHKGAPPLSGAVPLDSFVCDQRAGGGSSVPLREYGKSGAFVAEQIVACLNLQPCQEALLTTAATFAMMGGNSLAATLVCRSLYSFHHNVHNSRHLGGQFGNLEGPFAVVHLLNSRNLGEYVDLLDKHGFNPRHPDTTDNGDFKTPSTVEASEQDFVAGSSLQTGNNPEEANAAFLYDALLQAVTSGQSILSVALLNIGADPNAGSHGGRLGKISGRIKRKKIFRANPMHLACLKGMVHVVEKLLEKGCKFNSPDASGAFPIHLAASGDSNSDGSMRVDERARVDCIMLLLQAGAPLTMKDSSKQTVLHAAARAGHSEILRYVMKIWKDTISIQSNKKDSLDWRDHWARTPVHWAILNGHVDALEALLDLGCSATPVKLKEHKVSSSVAIESPSEMNARLFGSTDKGVAIAALLRRHSVQPTLGN